MRYQKLEDKLYIAQLYFPLVGQVFDSFPPSMFDIVVNKFILLMFYAKYLFPKVGNWTKGMLQISWCMILFASEFFLSLIVIDIFNHHFALKISNLIQCSKIANSGVSFKFSVIRIP